MLNSKTWWFRFNYKPLNLSQDMSMQAILNVKNDQKLQAWLQSPLIEVQVEILTVAKVGPSFNMSMGWLFSAWVIIKRKRHQTV